MADSDPSIPEDEYRRWLEPDATLTMVNNKTGNYQKSYAAILKRGGAGLIRAAAKRIDRHDAGGKVTQSVSHPLVAAATLKSWHDHYSHSNLSIWTSGDCELTLDQPIRHVYGAAVPYLAYYGIRFEPAGIYDLAGQQQPAPQPSMATVGVTPAKHPGGAPPKDYWESVWVQIAADIINGDFDPKKQADVEEAIQRIVMDLGHDVGSTTARTHAKLLWNKIKQGP